MPKNLMSRNVVIIDNFLASTHIPASETVTVLGEVLDASNRVACIIGDSGKTRALQSICPKAVWMYTQEIVNCELGESNRIVRSLFITASSRRPSILILDDADKVLSTSGRIMKEIVEEIAACIGEFSNVFFVYSSLNKLGIPEIILHKTNRFIQL